MKKHFLIGSTLLLFLLAGCQGQPSSTLSSSGESKADTPTTNQNQVSETQPQPQEQHAFMIGDKVPLTDSYFLTVNEVKPCNNSKTEIFHPEAGNKFINIDVIQENTGADSQDYNVYYFKLQDDKAFSYQPSIASCFKPSFSSGKLAKDQKTRGYVTFEIPKDNTPTQLIFSQPFGAEATVNLEQKK